MTTATTLSNPKQVNDMWKYAVGSYEFGDVEISQELDDENPSTGRFSNHVLTFRQQDSEYVVSCAICARRVEVEGNHTPEQRRAVGMYAVGHFLDHECKEVDISAVEDFYLGEMAYSTVLDSLKHDLAERLFEEAEVLRHGQ